MLQYLDFSALEHNALFFKKILGDSKLCAVVKNDAYGHGIIHMARYLADTVDCFAVGSVDEAKKIGFLGKDVLILLPQSVEDTRAAIDCEYVLSVDSFATLDTVISAAVQARKAARIHIKIDSGMTRLGFRHNDMENLINVVKNNVNLRVEGVYSHFYGESTAECDKQLSAFMPCAEAIEKSLCKRLIKHIANSCGTLLSSAFRLDMARVGLGLYGYGHDRLAPVKTVTAKVVAVKDVRAGEAVGYGAKYVAERNGSIAVINTGYAMGFSRSLVGSFVKINGAMCRVVAVCMAMIMADVTDVKTSIWDDVVLLGNGVNIANDEISIYELLCNLK